MESLNKTVENLTQMGENAATISQTWIEWVDEEQKTTSRPAFSNHPTCQVHNCRDLAAGYAYYHHQIGPFLAERFFRLELCPFHLAWARNRLDSDQDAAVKWSLAEVQGYDQEDR